MEPNEEQKKMKKAERLAKRREQRRRRLLQETEKHYSETRKTVYLFITKCRGNILLEIVKPNEGKFALNIDLLFLVIT